MRHTRFPSLQVTRFIYILLAPLVIQSCGTTATQDSITSREQANALLCRPFGKGPFPALIWSHGQVTNPQMLKKSVEFGWKRTCERLAADGFLAFIPVREFSSDRAPPQIPSNKNGLSRAVDYVKSLPETDPSRVALMGHSRGGLLTLMVGLE